MSQINDSAADVNVPSKALFDAVKNNDVLEVKRLLSLGADIEQRCDSDFTPLSWACFISTEDSHIDTIEVLLKNGANVNVVNEDYEDYEESTPLHFLTSNNAVKTVKLLLGYQPNLNEQDDSGESPLYMAIENRHFEIVKLLLDHGADVNLVNPEDGLSPLHVAVQRQLRKNLPFLGDYLGDYNIRDLKLVQLILDHGADVNATDPFERQTPLHSACCCDNKKLIKMLLKYGANIHAREIVGRTPLIYRLQEFISSTSKEVLVFLLQHSDVNSVDSKWDNILSSSTYESLDKVILEHIALLMVLNLPVDSKLKKIILNSNRNGIYHVYFGKCHDELMTAKDTKLKNSWVTFFNLLVDSRKKIKNYACNEDIVSDIKNSECLNKFPIYGAVMQKNMEKGIRRRKLFDKSIELLSDCLPKFNSTHSIIKDILNCMLSKKDLSYFCEMNKTFSLFL